jgi:hypothetical protein
VLLRRTEAEGGGRRHDQGQPAVVGTSTDPGLWLTQAVATSHVCYGGRSDGPCVDHGGVAELSGAPRLSRPARSAGGQQPFVVLSSTLSRDTTQGYALKAGQLTYDCRYSTMHGMPVTGGRGFRGLKPLWYNGVPP